MSLTFRITVIAAAAEISATDAVNAENADKREEEVILLFLTQLYEVSEVRVLNYR